MDIQRHIAEKIGGYCVNLVLTLHYISEREMNISARAIVVISGVEGSERSKEFYVRQRGMSR